MGVSPVRIAQLCVSDGRDARATSENVFVKQSLVAGGCRFGEPTYANRFGEPTYTCPRNHTDIRSHQ